MSDPSPLASALTDDFLQVSRHQLQTHLVVKPAIVSFFDPSVDGSAMQLDQTSLGAKSEVVGRTLAEANVRQRWGLGVVAVQRGTEVMSSPPPDFRLRERDVLVVFGPRPKIQAFDEACG